MIQFGGRYTLDQLKDAQVAVSGLRRPFRWLLLPILAVFVLGLLVPALHEGFTPETLFLPLVVVGVVAVVYFRFRWKTRRSFESNQLLQAPLAGTADESGLTLKSEYADTRTPWPVYFQAKVSPRVVLLYQSTSQALFLPRELFASDDDWNRFVDLVRTNVKPPPRSRWRSLVTLLIWMIIVALVIYFRSNFSNP